VAEWINIVISNQWLALSSIEGSVVSVMGWFYPRNKLVPAGVAGTDLCPTAGFAGIGGAAGDPGECVWSGASAGGGVGGGAEELGDL